MSESSIFWITNGTGDGTDTGYTQAQMFEWLRAFFTTTANLGGVAPDYQDKLAVSGTSSPVSVATGAGLVYGIPYVNTGAVNVAVATPTTATRIDRIVLRADYTAQTVRITRIAGTEGGAAPSLTQSAGTTWDVPLAQVSITTAGVITVTDQREYLSLVGDNSLTTAKYQFASVDSAAIGGFAIQTGHIYAGAVTTVKIADDAVTQAKIGASAVGTTELADSAVTSAKIADNSVTRSKIPTFAVGADQIDAGAVGASELATGAVTEAKLGTGAVTETKLGTGAVTTAKIADDAVTVDKAGAGLPVLIKRQGGDTSNWQTYGTTTYTPSGVRMQAGVRRYASPPNTITSLTITFPEAFSNVPIFLFANHSDGALYRCEVTSTSTTQAVIRLQMQTGDTGTYLDVNWLAIGPE